MPQPDGRLRITFTPLDDAQTGTTETDLLNRNQRCLDFGQDLIRRHPEHWLWTYKRWKRRPTPEQGRYPFYSKFAPVGAAVAQPSSS